MKEIKPYLHAELNNPAKRKSSMVQTTCKSLVEAMPLRKEGREGQDAGNWNHRWWAQHGPQGRVASRCGHRELWKSTPFALIFSVNKQLSSSPEREDHGRVVGLRTEDTAGRVCVESRQKHPVSVTRLLAGTSLFRAVDKHIGDTSPQGRNYYKHREKQRGWKSSFAESPKGARSITPWEALFTYFQSNRWGFLKTFSLEPGINFFLHCSAFIRCSWGNWVLPSATKPTFQLWSIDGIFKLLFSLGGVWPDEQTLRLRSLAPPLRGGSEACLDNLQVKMGAAGLLSPGTWLGPLSF